jgi:hypothetical protein
MVWTHSIHISSHFPSPHLTHNMSCSAPSRSSSFHSVSQDSTDWRLNRQIVSSCYERPTCRYGHVIIVDAWEDDETNRARRRSSSAPILTHTSWYNDFHFYSILIIFELLKVTFIFVTALSVLWMEWYEKVTFERNNNRCGRVEIRVLATNREISSDKD